MKLRYISYDDPKIPGVSHNLHVVIALFLYQCCIMSVPSSAPLLLKWESTHILTLTNKMQFGFFFVVVFVLFCFFLFPTLIRKNHPVLSSTLVDKIMKHLGKPAIKKNTSKPTQINLACHNAHTRTTNGRVCLSYKMNESYMYFDPK